MAYTWTNGELITADKLNQTGGGGSDVLIMNVSCTEDVITEEVTTTSCDMSKADVIDAITGGKVVVANVNIDMQVSGSTIQNSYIPILLGATDDTTVNGCAVVASGATVSALSLVYSTDDTPWFTWISIVEAQ